MAATMKDLGIDQLSPNDRATLALEIWESLSEDLPRSRLTGEETAELVRRDAELDADPSIALTWQQIRRSIEAQP